MVHVYVGGHRRPCRHWVVMIWTLFLRESSFKSNTGTCTVLVTVTSTSYEYGADVIDKHYSISH